MPLIDALSNDARRAVDNVRIEEQWGNVERYLVEYRGIVGDALPADIAGIAAHFGPVKTATQGSQAQPSQGGTTYHIHIERAYGTAIGDGARVIPPAEDE